MFEVQALTAPCNVLTTRSETGSGDVTSGIAETKLARLIGAFVVSTDLYSRCPLSLHALKDRWDKSNVRG